MFDSKYKRLNTRKVQLCMNLFKPKQAKFCLYRTKLRMLSVWNSLIFRVQQDEIE